MAPEVSAGPDTIEHMFEDTRLEESTSPAPRGYPCDVYVSSFEEQAALVALLRTRPNGLSWPELTTRVRDEASVERVIDDLQPNQALFPDPEFADALAVAEKDVHAWHSEGLTFLTILDGRYPASMRDIHQAPPFLFARGELRESDPGISIVGSRNASPSGLKIAEAVAIAAVEDGLSVISGLAAGIDTVAHTTALRHGGRPVGVIGTGIRKAYPAANRELHGEVAERGLLLSQFWPDAPPQKHTFLMRNATMSGYGLATVVVEAGEHSGARAQARIAVEHGRPVVLTDLVFERTQWAKTLEGRPGVTIASSTQDVVDAIRQIRAADDSISDAIRSLVSA